tara:strand:+ start:173 stop:859 length:687 start_codon:yes stop_codon:yes gene_type:complete
MPLPAIAGALLSQAATSLGNINSGVPYLFENPSEQENARQVAKLKHLMESGALGLTNEERQRILTEQQGAAENQLAKAAQAAANIQASAIGSGEQLKRGILQGQTAGAIRQDINQGVERLNQEKALRQEGEYSARLAADSEAKGRRAQAWLSLLTGGLAGATDTANLNAKLTGATAKPADVSTEDIASQFMKDYGISQEDADALAGSTSDDPELAIAAARLLGNTGAN